MAAQGLLHRHEHADYIDAGMARSPGDDAALDAVYHIIALIVQRRATIGLLGFHTVARSTLTRCTNLEALRREIVENELPVASLHLDTPPLQWV